MDNLDKILPLLIIAASFILSIVSSARKAKAQKQEQQTSPVPPVKKPEVLRKPVEKPVQKSVPVRKGLDTKYRPENVEPVVSALNITNQSSEFSEPILQESNFEQESFAFNIQDVDEIKRAVIYSEILTRKYE